MILMVNGFLVKFKKKIKKNYKMKKLKEISLIQWAYIALGALVVNKFLKAKVGVVMKPLPDSTLENINLDSSLVSSLVTNVVSELGSDIVTPFTDPQMTILQTVSNVNNQFDFDNTQNYFK